MACTPEQARLNSQKSTGPKTAQGKAIVSKNARKHGLTSRKPPLLESENVVEFRQLFQQLLESYQPTDAIEQHLIEKIAMGIHRQRRLWYAEITIKSDSVPEPVALIEQRETWEYVQSNLKTYKEYLGNSKRTRYHPVSWDSYCGQTKNFAETALFRLSPPKTHAEKLRDAQSREFSSVAQNKFLDSAYVFLVRLNWYAGSEIESLKKNEKYRPATHSYEQVGTILPTELRSKIDTELQQINSEISNFRDAAIERQRTEGLVKILERSDLVARYESHLTRELQQAIAELERLRGLKLGGRNCY